MNYLTKVKIRNFNNNTQIKIYDTNYNYFCFNGDYDDTLVNTKYPHRNNKYKLKNIHKIEITDTDTITTIDIDLKEDAGLCKSFKLSTLSQKIRDTINSINLNKDIINTLFEYIGLYTITIDKERITDPKVCKCTIRKKPKEFNNTRWVLSVVYISDNYSDEYDSPDEDSETETVEDVQLNVLQYTHNKCIESLNRIVNSKNINVSRYI